MDEEIKQAELRAEAAEARVAECVSNWSYCVFDGPPPAGYGNWQTFIDAPVKSYVYVRATNAADYRRQIDTIDALAGQPKDSQP
jgi:hypothetical protein